jgi:hypothetical protein
MDIKEAWNALAGRIHGLEAIASAYRHVDSDLGDSQGVNRLLRARCVLVGNELHRFLHEETLKLPNAFKASIDSEIRQMMELIQETSGTPIARKERAILAIVILSSIKVELEYVLNDVQSQIIRRCERAVLHLQRMLMVDAEMKRKWSDALNKGEVSCEKLGALHFLQHGIWTFKANSEGQRTDLILQRPMFDMEGIWAAVEGITLTEWKVAQSPHDIRAQFDVARNQADRYSSGVLAASELKSVRYLFVVTSECTQLFEDFVSGNMTYRCVVIDTNPPVPSTFAKRAAAGAPKQV